VQRIDVARKRAEFVQAVRDFFRMKGYLEVETPILSPFLIPEPSIEVFSTEFIDPNNGLKKCSLVPSPELWMKRLLSEGFPSIFQINKCFRNYESRGKLHNPEFTMLEWYTIDSGYMDEAEFAEDLLRHIVLQCRIKPVFDSSLPFIRISMKDAFAQYASLDLDKLSDIESLQRAAGKTGIFFTEADSLEELFNKIFLTFVETRLPVDRPVILYDYPSYIPTLASKNANELYYERWELYINGNEIANCYSEERNPQKVKSFIEEEAKRKKHAKVRHQIDVHFDEIFNSGFPRCAGTALGMDRLFMSLFNINSIEDTILFPFTHFFSS
jgi:elongation factor P--(R)-beta-lysine ligase